MAHARASAGAAVSGRQVKMAWRLGVSPGPVTAYGPPMATALTAALPW